MTCVDSDFGQVTFAVFAVMLAKGVNPSESVFLKADLHFKNSRWGLCNPHSD